MDNKSNDSLIKNHLFKKMNFERNSNNCSFGISKLLWHFLFLKIFIFLCLFVNLIKEFKKQKNDIKIIISLIKRYLSNEQSIISTNDKNMTSEIYLDKYETDIYNNIKNKIIGFPCIQMWDNQREFLNGVVRRFRPKKIVEIGVAEGCGSSIILNAIQDLIGSHLYSIDLSDSNLIGECTKKLFPNLLSKWTLYKGNIAAKYMEEIGSDIDMVIIDSAHFEPGEILDFIMVLPFVNEGAVIVIHDIANQITIARNNSLWVGKRNEWAPYIIFNSIRGKI
jgi:predicted O-methyltransferase YrrM